jgi:acyl carrier protein
MAKKRSWTAVAVAEKVRETLVNQLGVDEEELTPDAHIREDLGADSLDDVEVVMALEEEFDIEIDDEAAERVRTVQQIIDHVTAALRKQDSLRAE